MAGEGVTETLNVFEPADRREAVEGWALHATRRRIIHEDEARRLDRLRYWLGGLSTALAAVPAEPGAAIERRPFRFVRKAEDLARDGRAASRRR
jgi:hypothetical protein